jgi:hypothetical protein
LKSHFSHQLSHERSPIILWVGTRAGLDNMEKWKFFTLLGLEFQPLHRAACS